MTILRSIGVFILAGIAEIGGAWLIWRGVREKRRLIYIGAGVIAFGLEGFFATFQPSPHFGRVLAAYGGTFVAGSLAWGVIFDGFRPDRLRHHRRRHLPPRRRRHHVRAKISRLNLFIPPASADRAVMSDE